MIKINPLIEQLKRYGDIEPNLQEDLNRRIVHIEKNKDDFFLKSGQLYSSLFVIEKGLCRGFFIKDGKEINTWFAKENELIGSILPLFSKKSSYESIQFLEDTTLYAISSDNLNELYRIYPEFNIVGRKIAEFLCEFLEERIVSLHTDNAEARYKTLMATRPDIIQRVNLGHIASFLGITQETLSRIRSRF